MSPFLKKMLMSAAGAAIGALPMVLPVLAPAAPLFIAIGAALGGGAWVKSPGDHRPTKPGRK